MSTACCSPGAAELRQGELSQNKPQTPRLKMVFFPFAAMAEAGEAAEISVHLPEHSSLEAELDFLSVGRNRAVSAPSTPSEGFNEKINSEEIIVNSQRWEV